MRQNYLKKAETSFYGGMNMSMSIAISSSISSLYKLPEYAGMNRFIDSLIFNYVVDTHMRPITLSNFDSVTDNFLYRGMFQVDKYAYNLIAKTLIEKHNFKAICKNSFKNNFFVEPCKGAIMTGAGMIAFYEVVAIEELIPKGYKWHYILGSIALSGVIIYYIGGVTTASAIWSLGNIIKGTIGYIGSFVAMDIVHLIEIEGHQFPLLKECTVPMITLAAVSFVAIRSSSNSLYKFTNSIFTETVKITAFAAAKMFVAVEMEVATDFYEYIVETLGNSITSEL